VHFMHNRRQQWRCYRILKLAYNSLSWFIPSIMCFLKMVHLYRNMLYTHLNIYVYLISCVYLVQKFSVLMTEFIHTLAGITGVLWEELSKRTQNNIWSTNTASLVVWLKPGTFDFFGFCNSLWCTLRINHKRDSS